MAMAHGLPIVSTPTHHALELLHNSRGLLVDYEDDGSALAEALSSLLKSGSLRTMMVRGALDTQVLSFRHSALPCNVKQDGGDPAPSLGVLLPQVNAVWVMQGARAQQMVTDWTWENVALQYAKLISEGNISLLGDDPFNDTNPVKPSAVWHGQAIKFLNGRQLLAGSLPHSFQKGCMHALFVDVDIQVCSHSQEHDTLAFNV